MSTTRLDSETLERFAAALLETYGAPETHAERVARSLVLADASGHTSHGVLRVPYYGDLIADGVLDPTATPTVDRSTATTVKMDGRDAFGQVVGRDAVAALTERARDGVAVVGLRDATHLGRVGEWAERVADEGLLFAAFVNSQGGGHTVAPAGSATRRLSTNPIAFGIPAFDALEFDLVLDMATSQVAHGKIREREATGDPIPEGWTTDEAGEYFLDAAAFEAGEGALMPLGGEVAGYKGFGLSLVAELFAGLVGDGLVAGEREPGFSNNAAAFVAVDPLAFTTRTRARERLDALTDHLAEADYGGGPSAGVAAKGEGKLPGEPEFESRARAREDGVAIPDRIFERLRDVATDRGVAGAVPER
ncbi:MAG: Ldh family oxidoreductase [Haloferacaceae archaeon]